LFIMFLGSISVKASQGNLTLNTFLWKTVNTYLPLARFIQLYLILKAYIFFVKQFADVVYYNKKRKYCEIIIINNLPMYKTYLNNYTFNYKLS